MFGIEKLGIEQFIYDKDIGKPLLNLMKYSLTAHFFVSVEVELWHI